MSVRLLGGRGMTRRDRNPRLQFDLRTRPGDANIKSVAVTLPKAFVIDQSHLGDICSRAQLEEEMCRGRDRIGNVFVKTPLLDRPLRGPAYAVSGFRRLPRIAFVLDGQVRLIPMARSRANRSGKLTTTVPVVPDAPIGHFRLTLLGGSEGYLVNTRDLCAHPPTIRIRFDGQNGKRRTEHSRLRTPCRGGS
jgi:hypothetical protein